MDEQEARRRIAAWAKRYYYAEKEDSTPEVSVLNCTWDDGDEEWTAELEVSTSADNPTVTFWMDEGCLYPTNIEY